MDTLKCDCGNDTFEIITIVRFYDTAPLYTTEEPQKSVCCLKCNKTYSYSELNNKLKLENK